MKEQEKTEEEIYKEYVEKIRRQIKARSPGWREKERFLKLFVAAHLAGWI